ncbi:MAG TPA: hypothetical protein VE439_01445 [Anaerolineae bacterium]|nr:hypothetical protein [Anaerolineae bacterium]
MAEVNKSLQLKKEAIEVFLDSHKIHKRAIKGRNQRQFLTAFILSNGNRSKASEASGISRQCHYKWQKIDPIYAAAFEEAEDIVADALEAEAWRRAVDGVEEPIFYQGEYVDSVRKYSDTLLIFLLKGAKPEKYKDRAHQTIAGDKDNPLHVRSTVTRDLTDEEKLDLIRKVAINVPQPD